MKNYKLNNLILSILLLSCEETDTSLGFLNIDVPKNNSTVTGIVTINCSFNNINNIDNVELWIDGVFTGINESSEPFSLSWDTSNYEDKEYSITVRSFDKDGNNIDSEPVVVSLYKTIELFGKSYSVENTIELNLNNTLLVGQFPLEIIKLVNLTLLDLSFNQFNGQIPSEIKNLENLKILNLKGNQFTGTIPHEIGLLKNLNELKLSMNQLSGLIPNSIMNLDNLTNINLSINQLEGLLPDNFDNLTYLTFLNLSNNNLIGSIPYGLESLESLTELKLYRNKLSGELSQALCDLIDNNCLISLYDNQFCPPYPSCMDEILGEQETSNCD